MSMRGTRLLEGKWEDYNFKKKNRLGKPFSGIPQARPKWGITRFYWDLGYSLRLANNISH
jgi:hypothetical protein